MNCLVIGAGIGGLTLRLRCARGLEAHVYEAAAELREVGAGIWMPPNSMQVLARLDVAGAVAAAGRPVLRGEIRDRRHGLATTPNLGQGAAQVVEDAFVLADRLAASPSAPERATLVFGPGPLRAPAALGRAMPVAEAPAV